MRSVIKIYKIESHGMDGQDAVNVDDSMDYFSIEWLEEFVLVDDYEACAALLLRMLPQVGVHSKLAQECRDLLGIQS